MNTFLVAILSSVIYSILFYLKKAQKGEQFNIYKFGGTLLTGVLVGILMYFQGMNINEMTFEQQIALNMGLISIFENILKFGFRSVAPNRG